MRYDPVLLLKKHLLLLLHGIVCMNVRNIERRSLLMVLVPHKWPNPHGHSEPPVNTEPKTCSPHSKASAAALPLRPSSLSICLRAQ